MKGNPNFKGNKNNKKYVSFENKFYLQKCLIYINVLIAAQLIVKTKKYKQTDIRMGAKVFKGIDKYHLCDKSFKRFLLLLYEIINLSKDCTV
jgi:hypothetical protein